eukprot:TRINITY_DN14599_c0_g4_i1.p1 TRINITY_DN14599_c0_g4~~TRINITY_DN14599_c0_g4_i1.p1  ORF type:complete len:362 (+),score=72.06 TRINITY_DN14599_c0_g4_i1:1082-2167(+)
MSRDSSSSYEDENNGANTAAQRMVGQKVYHSCWKKKHIVRVLAKKGWEAEPAAKGAEACRTGGICYVQKVSGCKCGALWKLVPKSHMDCLGGKVSLAKLLLREGITEVAPTTFFNFDTFNKVFTSNQDSLGTNKWYVKVSHLNARKGVTCFPSAQEAHRHCAAIEKGKPSWYRYVIQEQVPDLYLHEGKKMLLRMWAFITVHPSTDIYLHVSKRMRANCMNNEYQEGCTERDADVEHDTANVFSSTADWVHYKQIWALGLQTAIKVVRAMVRFWDRKGYPAPLQSPSCGLFNHLAFDFVPSVTPQGLRPYLLEVNVDPSFRNKCPETRAFAEDIVEFFVEQAVADEPLLVPDLQFTTVQVR